jgi:hypothetical protein
MALLPLLPAAQSQYTDAQGKPSQAFFTFLNGFFQWAQAIETPGSIKALNATAIPAGGTAGTGLLVSSTANFGVFFGSGAPTLTAAKGSLYLRSDGTTTNNRAYINTDGGTTWTALTTAA